MPSRESVADRYCWVEPLEARALLIAAAQAIDTSTVGLYNPDGTPATANRHLATWVVIHALQASKDDSGVRQQAQAIQAQLPAGQWQVLILDWKDLASAAANPDNNAAYANAWAAGDKIAAELKADGIRGARLNLVGVSFGGQVADRIAKDYGQVNRIIAVDPAAPGYATNSRGHLLRHLPDFAGHSQYSLAFGGNDHFAFYAAGLTCDDDVLLTGLDDDQLLRHVDVSITFTSIVRRDAGLEPSDAVSPLFSITNILDGALPPWKKNTVTDGYEATMACVVSPQTGQYGPNTLTYVNRRGHQAHVP